MTETANNPIENAQHGLFLITQALESFQGSTPQKPTTASPYIYANDFAQGEYGADALEKAWLVADETGLPLLIGPARDDKGEPAPWRLERNLKLTFSRGFGVIQGTTPEVELRFEKEAPEGAHLTLATGKDRATHHTGSLRNLQLKGPKRAPKDRSALLRLDKLKHFLLEDLRLNNADVGIDYRNNCFGTQANRLRSDFGTLNVALNLAGTTSGHAAHTGSDLGFNDCWIHGRRAAVVADKGGGGYRFLRGQLGAGQETKSKECFGVIECGFDYLTGPRPGEKGFEPGSPTGVTLSGTSFEGWWDGDVLFCWEGIFGAEFASCNFLATKTGSRKAGGLFTLKNAQRSHLVVTGATRIGGHFSKQKLWDVSGALDISRFSEDFYSAALGSYSVAGKAYSFDHAPSPMMLSKFGLGTSEASLNDYYYRLEYGRLTRTKFRSGSAAVAENWQQEKTTYLKSKSLKWEGLAS